MRSIAWQPRLDKRGPLFWNTVTLQCILQLQEIYGVPYDWFCLREGMRYRYYINTETLQRSGELLYTQLRQNRSATLAGIGRHKLLLRNLRSVHRQLQSTDASTLRRQQLNALFERVLAAHVPANGFVFFGGIIDTWAERLESMLREQLPATSAKKALILLLTDSDRAIPRVKRSSEIRTIATVIRSVGQALFELREQIEQNRARFTPVLEEIRRRMKINPTHWKYVSEPQISRFLRRGILPSKAAIRANMGTLLLAVVDGKKRALRGAVAKQWYTTLIGEDSPAHERIIQGTCASTGKICGKVRVVRNASDFSRFRAGEVLVTFMTTPFYVPIMTKAAAVVTEVGGITSHAAVVSRELGKPCLVGVRNATSLLKTGESVEINANQGTIEKLM